MSSTKRKLAGLIFEIKEVGSPNLFPGKIADIKKDNKISSEYQLSSSKINSINNNNKIYDMKKYTSNKINKFYLNSNKEISLENSIDFINNIKGVKLENKNKSNISLEEKNPIKYLNKKELILLRKNVNLGISDPFQIKENPLDAKKSKQKKVKYIFPYFYFFLDFFLDKLIYPQKFFCLPSSYFTVYNFMCQIYDISTHIILFKHFNLLNKIVKNMHEKEENCQHKILNKINISDKRIVDRINCDLKSRKSILFSNNLV